MSSIDVYYDVVCPYAYLASTQMSALAERSGVSLEWKPILLGGLINALYEAGAVPMNANKAAVNFNDLGRWSAHYNIPFQFPSGHPIRTVDAMRILCDAEERREELTHALYRAYWVEGRNVSDRKVLADIAGEEAVARLDSPDLKADLRQRTQDAYDRGVFGVPTFVVGDQMFWGQDRLHFVEKALHGWKVSAP